MINRRWEVALHEAGHLAAALALNGRVAHASIGHDGSGIAHCECPSSSDAAFMVAAGPVAQELLADVPAPTEEAESYKSKVPSILPLLFEGSDAEECRAITAARGVTRGLQTESDERFLALWAITGFEDYPEKWLDRVVFARYVAAKIVTANREEIVRIATALYHRTTIFEQEILAAFKGDSG